MAAPIHVPFRSVSLASSLDEEKKRPFHQVHEINLSEKQHKQPKCYKPFTTRTPFLSFIALFAVALLILCEALAHHYGDFQKAMKIPVPQIPGVAAPYKKRDLSKRSLAGTSKVRRDTEDVFKYSSTPETSLDVGQGHAESFEFLLPSHHNKAVKDRTAVDISISVSGDDSSVGVLGVSQQSRPAAGGAPKHEDSNRFLMWSGGLKKRDPEPEPGVVVEIAILADASPLGGGCGGGLVEGRVITCAHHSSSGFLLPPRDLSEHEQAKRQETGTNSTASANASTASGSTAAQGGSAGADPWAPYRKYLFTPGEYFIVSYLLIFLAFFMRIFWTSAYNSIRLMEPFYALAQPGGATAEHALTCMYLHDSLLPEPVRSLRGKQWLMFIASLTSILVALLPAMSLGVLRADDQHCPVAVIPVALHPCAETIYYQNWVLRIFETMLILIFLTVGGFAALNSFRSSGVYSDPSAIATLASLLHHPTMLERFRRADDSTSEDELEEIFSGDRYRIAGYRTLDLTTQYGIVPVGKTGWVSRSATEDSISSLDKSKARLATRQLAPRPQQKRWRTMASRVAMELILLFALLLLLGFVTAYYADGNQDAFNTFFNEGDFWPKFVLTIIGSIIASGWRRIECQTRTQAPYERLRKPGPATPLLTPTTSSCWTSLPFSIFRLQPFVALNSFTAILSELLLVALSGVAFSPYMLQVANNASMYAAMGILSFMVLVLGVHVFRKLRGGAWMLREPDTLLGVWSYLAASEMREGFEGLALTETNVRARRVQSWGKSFRFGEHICVDGVQRLALDEVQSGCGSPA